MTPVSEALVRRKSAPQEAGGERRRGDVDVFEADSASQGAEEFVGRVDVIWRIEIGVSDVVCGVPVDLVRRLCVYLAQKSLVMREEESRRIGTQFG